MSAVLTAILVTAFVWWFSTGAILIAVRRAESGGERARVRLVLAAAPILVLGVAGFLTTLGEVTPLFVYGGFLAAIAIWGWLELAFLAGVVTGPVNRHCPPNAPWWERFIRAWGTIAYAEMALIATLAALMVFAWEANNTVGMWTFVILFFARISAKLNLYLGVPKINLEFLPEHLKHLESHFRIGAVSRFFPVAITGLTLALGCWMERAAATPAGSADQIAFVLLATLTGLALLEHWLMVLPIPDAKLWTWAIDLLKPQAASSKPPTRPYNPEDAHGL